MLILLLMYNIALENDVFLMTGYLIKAGCLIPGGC